MSAEPRAGDLGEAGSREADRTDTGAVDAENPWPGLAAFREADRELFFGRDAETAELARLVLRERVCVLFGLSGLGKTSLLHAGLFPRLRPENVLPVSLRLAFNPEAPPLAAQVLTALAGEAAACRVEAPAPQPGETLWELFHRQGAEWWSARNKPVVPLLVFDQFEEIFTLGRRSPLATDAFLDELADLAEGRPPAAVKARLDEQPQEARDFAFSRHPYKVLFCLREDYVAELEGLRGKIRAVVQNRMRLKRMHGRNALEVITRPGRQLVDEGVEEQIIRFVAGREGDASLASLEIEPALLSVVCRELNLLRRRQRLPRITADLLQGSREDILADVNGLMLVLLVGVIGLAWWGFSAQRRAERALAVSYLERGLGLGESREGLAWLAAAVEADADNVLARGHLASALIHTSWPLPVWEVAERSLTEDQPETGPQLIGGDNRSRYQATWAGGRVHVWDLVDKKELGRVPMPAPRDVLLGRSGRDLLVAEGPAAGVWDVRSGRRIARLPIGRTRASWRTRGDRFLYQSDGAGTGLWDPRTGRTVKSPLFESSAESLFSPDGRRVVVKQGGDLELHDLERGGTVSLPPAPGESFLDVDFTPAGDLLRALSSRQITFWDAVTGKASAVLPIPGQLHFEQAFFVPGPGSSIWTAEDSGQLRVWTAEPSWGQRAVLSPHTEGFPVGRGAGGRWLLLQPDTEMGEARLWDLATDSRLPSLPARRRAFVEATDELVTSAADRLHLWRIAPAAGTSSCRLPGLPSLVPAADRILSFDGAGLHVLDARTGRPLATIPGGPPPGQGAPAIVVALGGRFAMADLAYTSALQGPGATFLWDLQAKRLVRLPPPAQRGFLFTSLSPDGRWIARDDATRQGLTFQETVAGRPARRLASGSYSGDVQFGPGDRAVVVAKESLTFWDLARGKPAASRWELPGASTLALSQDGSRLAAGWEDGKVCVFDVARRKSLTCLPQRPGEIALLQFDAAHRFLLTGADGMGRLWEADTGGRRGIPFPLPSGFPKAVFSADSSRLLLWGAKTVSVLETSSGRPMGAPWSRGADTYIRMADFSPDGQSVRILNGDDRQARLDVWDLPLLPPSEALDLARLAEAVSGSMLDAERGRLVDFPDPIGRLNALRRETVKAPFGQTRAASLIRWFLADPAQRPRSPLTPETAPFPAGRRKPG